MGDGIKLILKQAPSYAERATLNANLQDEVSELKCQIAWFQKQIFGRKSERRHVEDNSHQIPLSGMVTETITATDTITVGAYVVV
jgi:hypothetical protein